MIDPELVQKMQTIRTKLGKAIKVTSGYRCVKHNADPKVGGSRTSRHLYGIAADWRTRDRSVNPVALGIIAAAQGFGAVGIYWHDKAAIVHTDTRGGKATWLCVQPGVYPSTTYNKFVLPTIEQGCEGAAAAAPRHPARRQFRPGYHKGTDDGPAQARPRPGWHLRPQELDCPVWRRQISVREEVIPVETWQILVTVGVPSGIFGFAVWLIERKIEQHERKRAEEAKKRENIEAQREKSREELQICIYETSLAAIALGEATAKAVQRIPDAHCNGDMHAALDYASKVKHAQREVVSRCGIKSIVE